MLLCSESSYLLGLGGMWAHLLDDELREGHGVLRAFAQPALALRGGHFIQVRAVDEVLPQRLRVRVQIGEALLVREAGEGLVERVLLIICLLYTSPSPRDRQKSRMPSSA